MARKKPIIYLDNAATTKIDPEAQKAMLPYLKESYGNAFSIHQLGQASRGAVDKAREQTARFLNCKPSEVIFTGNATESDNLAIFGVVKAAQKKGISKPHIITTQIEHLAVLEACKSLEKQGISVSYLPVSKEGIMKAQDVQKALKINTCLVSVMYANNEIGTIQPIAEIGKIVSEANRSKVYGLGFKVFFHTDAVQAANYLSCDVKKLGVDLLTLSSHKIYGPKGVGALYVKQGAGLEPIIFGGHQEQGLRPGTENVAGIVGMAEAIQQILNLKSMVAKDTNNPSDNRAQSALILNLKSMRDKLINGILAKVPCSRLNGSRDNRLPNNANFSFEGAEGEAIVIALDQEGVCASTGSACSSGSLEPSHVLLALGSSQKQAHGSLRLTLGKYTTEKEIDRALKVLPEIVNRLRKIAGRP